MENTIVFTNMINSNKIVTFFVIIFFGTIWILTQIPKMKKEAKAHTVPSSKNEWGDAYKKNNFLLGTCLFGGISHLILYLGLKPYEMNTSLSLLGFKLYEVLFYLQVGMVITFFGLLLSIYSAITIKRKYLTQSH
ncbi:hypothetical protein K9M47_02870 [Candidatus Gracilibacteria bacterium]|nr:hypothetical protein [Candidatus Gracilibacteria bacterium]